MCSYKKICAMLLVGLAFIARPLETMITPGHELVDLPADDLISFEEEDKFKYSQ